MWWEYTNHNRHVYRWEREWCSLRGCCCCHGYTGLFFAKDSTDIKENAKSKNSSHICMWSSDTSIVLEKTRIPAKHTAGQLHVLIGGHNSTHISSSDHGLGNQKFMVNEISFLLYVLFIKLRGTVDIMVHMLESSSFSFINGVNVFKNSHSQYMSLQYKTVHWGFILLVIIIIFTYSVDQTLGYMWSVQEILQTEA